MAHRRIVWTCSALLAGVLGMALPAGCKSVTVTSKGIEIVGLDGYTVKAIGLEEALEKSLDHVTELEKNPKPNREYILDWKVTINKLIEAKTALEEDVG
jgi:hypothetical protein